MGTIATMNVKLAMDSSDFDKGISSAKKSGESFMQGMSKVGGAMTAGLTLPILGVAAAAVKMSNEFNAGLANIASLGVASDRIKQMKSDIQALSIETGKATDDLTEGAYQVVSAFGDTADSMKILRTNAKLAKAGLSSTAEAIALTSAVTKGYNDVSAEAVTHVADLSIETVALGQTTLPEVANAIGKVVPLAGSLGIEMEDLFAVIATGAGVTGTTSEVSTQFRGILQSLMAPTDSMTKLTKKMGYTNAEAMLQGEGLLGTIIAVVEAADKAGAPLQDYIGSIEGQTLALALAGAQQETFIKNQEALQDVTGRADEAFLAQTQGINKIGFSMEQLQRYAEVLGQKLGDGLAPALAIVLDKLMPLADALIVLVDQFVKLDSATQGWILVGVGIVAALGPLLLILPGIAKGIGVVAGAMTLMSGPVGLLILAVAGLGVAWAFNWGDIQGKTAAAWAVIQPKLDQMLKTVQDLAMVQFTGFVSQLGEMDKIAIPEWLKVAGALFTGGQGKGEGIQAIPLSVEITPTIVQQEGAAFKWADGFLTFDVKGNLTAINQEGFFGESTGLNWDATKGFWMTINGELAFESTTEDMVNPGANAEFQEKLQSVKVSVTALPESMAKLGADIQAHFAIAENAIKLAPTVAAGAATTWATDWKAKVDLVLLSWQPEAKIVAQWADNTLVKLVGFMIGTFHNQESHAQVQADWGAGALPNLWKHLVGFFSPPISVFAEWGANVFGGLWSAIQGWFRSNPVTVFLQETFTGNGGGSDRNPYGTGGGSGSTPPRNSYGGIFGYASGGHAKGLSVVGEGGPELAFFGGMGADILSNPNSLKFLEALGIQGFAGGTEELPPVAGLAPPMGPRMAPPKYAVQPRPKGLYPPIGASASVGKALMTASESMSNAAESIADSADTMSESSEAFRSALQSVPGLFGTSEVTADQMRMAELGIPQEFADNYLRRLTDEVVNGVDWEGVDIGDAAAAAGIDPSLPAKAILEMFKAAWNDSSLFANPENLKFIDQGAVKAAIQKQQDQLAGQMNILALFGIKDESIATQVAGLGTILATSFQTEMKPETFAPVGERMMDGIASGMGDSGAAETAGGNMIGAVQTALMQADMQGKLASAGESAAAIYWDGWLEYFKTVSLPVPTPPGAAAPPGGKAAGGPVSSGVPYIVGERGKELFVPNVNGRIIPNDELGGWWDMSGMGSGAAVQIGQVAVYNEVDIRELAYQVAGYMQRRR